MKYLLSLLIISSLLAGCSFKWNSRQIASVEDDLKELQLKNYGPLNVGIVLIPVFDLKARSKAGLNISLESIRTKLLKTITLQGNADGLPTEDFFRLVEMSKDATDLISINQLKDQAKQLLVEVKGHYAIALEQTKMQERIAESERRQALERSVAERKFAIDKQILALRQDVQQEEILLNSIEGSLNTSKTELRSLKIIKKRQEDLLKAYLQRENLYSDNIKELVEYQSDLKKNIDELKTKISPAAIEEMIKSVSKCIVPEAISSVTDCQQAKSEIEGFIAILEKNIQELEAELANAEASLDIPSDTQVTAAQNQMSQKINKELLENKIAYIMADIADIRKEIEEYQEHIDTINATIASQETEAQVMAERIETLKKETQERINQLIFLRDDEAARMRQHAMSTLERNKDREDLLNQTLLSFIDAIQATEALIESHNRSKIAKEENIKALNSKIRNLEREKRAIR